MHKPGVLLQQGHQATGVLPPAGSPQQQTAAAGALQSLALQAEHHKAFMQCGAVPALVDMMGRQHVALASAAAGALCNLSLGSTQDKVSCGGVCSPPGRCQCCQTQDLWHCCACGCKCALPSHTLNLTFIRNIYNG